MNRPPLLLMLLGVTGSGKSYFARQLAEKTGAVRFNGDAMRHAIFKTSENVKAHYGDPLTRPMTFGAIDYAAAQTLRAGYDVIYDANNNSRNVRKNQQRIAADAGAFPVIIELKVSLELAKKRALEREETADQPLNSELIDEIITRNLANFDELEPDENVIMIDGMASFEAQLKLYNEQLENILRR